MSFFSVPSWPSQKTVRQGPRLMVQLSSSEGNLPGTCERRSQSSSSKWTSVPTMSQMLRFGMTKPTQQHLPIKHKKCLRRYSPAILPSDVWFLMLQSYFQNLISARVFEDMLPWSILYLGNLQRPNRRTCGKGNLPKIALAWVGELFWPDTIFLEGNYPRNQCLSPVKSLYFTGSSPWKCLQKEVFAFIFFSQSHP